MARYRNVFLQRVENSHFVYAPLARLSIEVTEDIAVKIGNILNGSLNSDDQASKDWMEFLTGIESVKPELDVSRNYIIDHWGRVDFRPTHVTLSLTTGCNLRCVYCYIHGGEENRSMPIAVAHAAIDFIADNALSQGIDSIGLTFHGEGEPTYNWPLFTSVVRYAESAAAIRKLSLDLSLQSNGLWSAIQRKFIFEKFPEVSISLDGLPDVQHAQRPTPNGKPSFQAIKENLIALKERDIPCTVRSTVMPDSVNKMNSLIQFLADHTNVRNVTFEPMEQSGRGNQVDVDEKFKVAFASRMLDAMLFGKDVEISVSYSGCNHIASERFCGATGDMVSFTVMADGTISSCYEVSSDKHELGEFFIFGKYDFEKTKFVFDQEKLTRLINYRSKANSPCGGCFAKWSCRGDCLTRYNKESLLNGGYSSRCSMNKDLVSGAVVQSARENIATITE